MTQCKTACLRHNVDRHNALDSSIPICKAVEWDQGDGRCELHDAIPDTTEREGIRCRSARCRVNPREFCSSD